MHLFTSLRYQLCFELARKCMNLFPCMCSLFIVYDLQVAHTGAVPATIEFLDPVYVSWVENSKTQTPIGVMNLTSLSSKHSRATIDQNTTFLITDNAAFSRFSGYLITSQNFTWRLQSSNLRVHALKFPVAKGISFDKTVTLNGIVLILSTRWAAAYDLLCFGKVSTVSMVILF